MNKKNDAEEEFGARYFFIRYMREDEIRAFLTKEKRLHVSQMIASLTIGQLRIDAVLYRNGNVVLPRYEVFVKDKIDSKEWICYDSPDDKVSYSTGMLEEEMRKTLDRIRDAAGLSYTGCNFDILDGKRVFGKQKKK
jgi:hypothetical protein